MSTYVSTTPRSNYGWLNGLIGGLVAGIIEGIVGMMGTLIMGMGLFWPLLLIGYAFRPLTDNPSQDAGTIIIGLLIHMATTMMFGLIFALIAPYLPTALPLWIWGMIYGIIIWLVGYLGVLNLLDPTMATKMNMILFFITHLVYGALLGWYLSWRTGQGRAVAP